MTHRVLVVDDDPQILRALRINLSAHGYHVLLAPDGAAALRAAADGRRTSSSWTSACRTWTAPRSSPACAAGRAARSSCSPHGPAPPRPCEALDAGADDYVTKPFGMPELLARLRAAVRRAGPPVDGGRRSTRATSPSTSRPRSHARGRQGGAPHPDRMGRVGDARPPPRKARRATRAAARGLGPGYGPETNYLRVYIAQLRRKLEREPAQAAAPDHRTGDGLPLRTLIERLPGPTPTGRRYRWTATMD